jgi:hypothetical protein
MRMPYDRKPWMPWISKVFGRLIMYESAIHALQNNEPEKAVLLIVQSMKVVQQSSELFEMEVVDAMHEITHSQNFLEFNEWRIS